MAALSVLAHWYRVDGPFDRQHRATATYLDAAGAYAMSFLIHALMWPIHLGRDRYDE